MGAREAGARSLFRGMLGRDNDGSNYTIRDRRTYGEKCKGIARVS